MFGPVRQPLFTLGMAEVQQRVGVVRRERHKPSKPASRWFGNGSLS
jgi:hypothetical protein